MSRIYPASYRKRIHAGSDGLDAIDVAILSTLSLLAEHGREDGWFTVTQKELAERLGMRTRKGKPSMKTLQRRLPVLEQRGFIEVRTTAKNGHYQASAYRLSLPVHATQSRTVTVQNLPAHATQSPTVHATQSRSADVTESQRLRSKSLRDDDDAALSKRRRSHRPTGSKSKPKSAPVPALPQAASPDASQMTIEQCIAAAVADEPAGAKPTDEQTRQRALRHRCPRCHARPGRPCVLAGAGPIPTPHRERRLLARRPVDESTDEASRAKAAAIVAEAPVPQTIDEALAVITSVLGPDSFTVLSA